MLRFGLLLLLTLVRLGASPLEECVLAGPTPLASNVRFQRGDDPQWARADFDDRDWRAVSLREMPSRDGIYWLRFRLDQLGPAHDSIGFAVVASYEVFWDGRLIGRSGVVGADAGQEVPGPVDNVFNIPDELNGPGPHVVALRMSSFHTGFPGPYYGVVLRIVNLRESMQVSARTTGWMMVGTGAALVVGVVFGLFWLLADRRAAVGWFSLACLGAGVERGLQAWRWLDSYPYSWHYPRLLVITMVVAGLGFLRVLFLQSFFQLRHTAWCLGALAVAMAAVWPFSPFYNVKALLFGSCTLSISVAITLAAWRRKRRGAGYVLAGLAVSLWGLSHAPTDFLEHSFIYNSGAVMLGCVTALTLQLRDDRRAAQQAVLTASRLETELLKKNLQPHFLINTLATIQEVIEQEPKTAVALIDALTAEFRSLARMSGERLVPLAQELELCHAHLEVMSLRKGARCALSVSGIDARALVPPALFHTLIENGLTHLLPRDGRLEFALRGEYHGDVARYSLVASGMRERTTADPGAELREGTGLRYVKARLEESFTGRWTLLGGPVPEGWETVIEIAGGAVPPPETAVREPAPAALPRERPA